MSQVSLKPSLKPTPKPPNFSSSIALSVYKILQSRKMNEVLNKHQIVYLLLVYARDDHIPINWHSVQTNIDYFRDLGSTTHDMESIKRHYKLVSMVYDEAYSREWNSYPHEELANRRENDLLLP